ncbi:MAG: tRNA uridine-5-carboxymethylaminomethyl(34) synthesis GTPase MnmE [Oscillospiraceae bacterium]|nr:tRNA uridine-5-carboxymethylaminomethyl(34) synthesis GTPase MnmE [Oscillospiraceae bacterium]
MSKAICALSTPYGRGGIAVIRVSGDNSIEYTAKIFKSKKSLSESESHTVIFGKAIDKNGVIDECLVTVFRAPRSFTGENVCEISCHGGTVVVNRILDALVEAGCALAEPGEFTKRAFMNGKLSLTQAEAVKDIIDARTDGALWAAVNRLEGGISVPIREIRGELLRLLAAIQVSSDFPEEDVEAFSGGDISTQLNGMLNTLNKLKNTSRRGEALRNGINCVICGVPNTGKSSLLNALCGRERAIVNTVAGTTRDVVEVWIDVEGIPVCLSDTAGIRESGDSIEQIGVRMSRARLKEADICVFLTEAGRPLTAEEENILAEIPCNVIKAANKCDLAEDGREDYIKISARDNIGVDKIRAAIVAELGLMDSGGAVIANRRQREAVTRAADAIERALKSLSDGFYSDLAAIDIGEAVSALGEAEGISINQELVDKIFEEFCLGK